MRLNQQAALKKRATAKKLLLPEWLGWSKIT
jgi:hypothetical protein